jgi:hypothetical protein
MSAVEDPMSKYRQMVEGIVHGSVDVADRFKMMELIQDIQMDKISSLSFLVQMIPSNGRINGL